MMKIAILNRAPLPQGGDGIALRHTVAALERQGVKAVHIWGGAWGYLTGFDLAHCFHLDFDWAVANYDLVRQSRVPYVSTPIFYPDAEGISDSVKRAILMQAKAVLPFSHAEGRELQARFGPVVYQPVPNGAGPEFRAKPSQDRVGVCASDWLGGKHTEVIEQACAELHIPFRRFKDTPYAEMPGELRKYRVFATATSSDRMSLAVGEALCAGCRVIASDANRGNEWYPGLATIHAGASADLWRLRIAYAYASETWDWTPNVVARRITWDSVATQLKAVYERALA
jgi:glycosyltransferase involved in cell wall biosynthesis